MELGQDQQQHSTVHRGGVSKVCCRSPAPHLPLLFRSPSARLLFGNLETGRLENLENWKLGRFLALFSRFKVFISFHPFLAVFSLFQPFSTFFFIIVFHRFSCFQPFSVVFNGFSIVFNHFQLFSIVFSFFQPFSTIFCHFQPFSTVLTVFKCFQPFSEPFSAIFSHFPMF